MDLKIFCELIKVDFCWLLYNYTYNNCIGCDCVYDGCGDDDCGDDIYLHFPECCKLASNLISSYLYVHLDDSFTVYNCNFTNKVHSWSSNGKDIVDFTLFQFHMKSEEIELFDKRKFNNKEQFAKVINNYECCYKSSDFSFLEENHYLDV